MARLLALLLGCIVPAAASAQATVLSPRPDSVSLTIYRDGIALVTETRKVDLPAGPARLVLEGVVDTLLPRSAVISGAARPPASVDFHFERLTAASLVRSSVGKPVTVVRTSPRDGRVARQPARILSADQGVVLQFEQDNEALYCAGLPERLEFQQVPDELTARPTLSVLLDDGEPGPRTVTISYLAHGFSWSADYVAHLNATSDRMAINGWITLRNDTSSSFRAAQVQVVAGRLNLLARDENGSRPPYMGWIDPDAISERTGLPETPLDRLRDEEELEAAAELNLLHQCYPLGKTTDGLPRPPAELLVIQGEKLQRLAMEDADEELAEVQVTGTRITPVPLGDYQLYRLPWPTDLAARQTKQAQFLDEPRVRVQRIYGMTLYNTGEMVVTRPEGALAVLLRWQNDKASGLGEPLPLGQVRILEPGAAGEVFAGEARIGDSPVGVPVEASFARAIDVLAELTAESLEVRRQGRRWSASARIAQRFVNDKDLPVVIEVRTRGSGGGYTTSVRRSSLRSLRERGDVVWRFELPAGAETWLRFELLNDTRYD